MTVHTPSCFGLIVRKNERTRGFIERRIENMLEMSPEARTYLNEDEHLIAFTVAMNGNDLDNAIEELVRQQAVYGTDFVATASGEGVLGDLPGWLSEKSERVGPFRQVMKFYSFV